MICKVFTITFEDVYGINETPGNDLLGVDYVLEISDEVKSNFEADKRRLEKATEEFLEAQDLFSFWVKRCGKRVTEQNV